MSATTEGEYIPPWLGRLDEEEPRFAKRFHEDPKLTTKLDHLLSGVKNVEDKYAIVWMALDAGFGPDDPLISMIIAATKIQRVMTGDFAATVKELNDLITTAQETIAEIKSLLAHAGEAATTQTATVQSEIRETTKLAIGAIKKGATETNAGYAKQREALSTVVSSAQESLAAVVTALDEFPKFTAQLLGDLKESLKTEASAAVNEHAKSFVAGKIEMETRAAIDNVNTAFDGFTAEVIAVRQHLEPLRKTVERAKHDERVLFFGFGLRHREWVALWTGIFFGGVMAALATLATTSVLHFGYDPQTLADIRAGRIYQAIYPTLPPFCKDSIDAVLHGRATVHVPGP